MASTDVLALPVSINDFQDGTAQGWTQGGAAPPLTAVPNSGPGGTGDFALQVVADGSGASGRLVFFNQTPMWTGNYVSRGIDGIEGVILNNSGQTLNLRAAIDGAGGRFSSASSFSVPSSSMYQPFTLNFQASDFTPVDGGTDINATLFSVNTLRLLHNPVPAWRGVNISGTFLFDSTPTPPPSLRWIQEKGAFTYGTATNWDPQQIPTLSEDVEFGPGLPSLNASARLTSSVTEAGKNMTFTRGSMSFEPLERGARTMNNSGEVKINDPLASQLTKGALVSLDEAEWNSTGDAIVGDDGYGTLTLASNGELNAPNLRIGDSASGTGHIDVVGTESFLANTAVNLSNNLTIGNAGVGTMNVTRAGAVSVANDLVIGSTTAALPPSKLNIDGRFSLVSVSGVTTIGRASEGEVNISNRGRFSTPGIITVNGQVSLDGLGTTLDASTMELTGVLTASARARATITNLNVGDSSGSSGSLFSTTASVVETTGSLHIWEYGLVTLDGGIIETSAITGPGTLNVIQGQIEITGPAGYTVGSADGPMERAFGTMQFQPQVGSNFFVEETLAVPVGTSVNQVSGILRANIIENNNLVTANDTNIFTTTALNNNADLVLIDATVNGPVNNAAGSTVTVVGSTDFNDLVSGSGNFFGPGTVNFNGGMSPGASPAAIRFEGDVTFGDSNQLFIELGGLIPGSEIDHLDVDGQVSLDGTLDVDLINDFTPTAGDTFEIITAANLLGTFDTEQLPTLAGGLKWFVDYQATNVSLLVAPTGDFDFDGDVDGDDFLEWQRTDGTPEGLVDWQGNYGTAPGPVSASNHVPEPSALWLLLAGVALLIQKKNSMLTASLVRTCCL